MDQETTDIIIVFVALFASIGLAAFLLTRARNRIKEETPETIHKVPASASRRQRRLLEKMDPDPHLPTVMDMVREEINELGLEEIPGHEDLSAPVMLKVYRRDFREACPHDQWEYQVADGVTRDEAEDADVRLVCRECDQEDTNSEDTTPTG